MQDFNEEEEGEVMEESNKAEEMQKAYTQHLQEQEGKEVKLGLEAGTS